VIEKALYAWLSGETDVTDLVGTRIFANKIAHGTAMPAVTYQLISGQFTRGLGGRCGSGTARMQINCWAETYLVAKDLELAIVGTKDDPKLDDFSGTLAGFPIQNVRINDVMDHPQNPSPVEDIGPFGVIIDLTIFYGE